MASVRPLTDLTVADLWKEVKDPATIWGDVSQQTLRTVKLLLENRMHDELADYLRAGRYVRDYSGRRGYRNGTYLRRLTTTWGAIPDLRIPRCREAPPRWRSLACRSEPWCADDSPRRRSTGRTRTARAGC